MNVIDREPSIAVQFVVNPIAPCDADFNGDGDVNVDDLLSLIAAWGESGVPEDINNDGTVDVDDLGLLLAAWGAC
jgi:hypothetical protein